MKRFIVFVLLFILVGGGVGFSSDNLDYLTYNEMLEKCKAETDSKNVVFFGEFLAVRIFPVAGKLATKENKDKLVLMADIKSENKKVFVLIPKDKRSFFSNLNRSHGEFDIKYTTKTIFNRSPVLDMKELVVEK